MQSWRVRPVRAAASELRRVKTQSRANFIRGIERIGGFGRQIDVLAVNRSSPAAQPLPGDGAAHRRRHRRRPPVGSGALAHRRRLDTRGSSYPTFETAASGADRTKLPEAGTPPEARFPAIARATLPNGLKIVLAERHSIPQVNLTLLVDAGYAADQFAAPGTASLALDMLDEGTTRRTAPADQRHAVAAGREPRHRFANSTSPVCRCRR